MEVKNTKNINENGSYTIKTTTKTTPKDGFVKYGDVMPVTEAHEENKKHKGYTFSFSYETKDPKKTRPFSIVFFTILFIVGIFFLFSNYFILKAFGIFWIIYTAIVFIATLKKINKIEQELKKYNKDNNKNI